MIISSAIKFYLKNDLKYPIIMTGFRHPDILEKMFKLRLNYDKSTMVQGFLDDKNQFLDRYEAKKEAIKHNQLIEETNMLELFSEDIWPE